MWSGLQNVLVAYADEAALLTVVPSSAIRSVILDSLDRGLAMIREWCRLWGMKMNPNKTQSMTVSRSTVESFNFSILISSLRTLLNKK